MRIFFTLSLFVIFIFLSGCTTNQQSLSILKKKEVYHSVVDEVKSKIRTSNKLVQNNYLNKALRLYNEALFYETGEELLPSKISSLEELISTKRVCYYKRGKKQLSKDPKSALISFNMLLRVDPNYKDAKSLFKQAKNIPSNKLILQKKERQIKEYFLKNELKSNVKFSNVIIDINILFACDDSSLVGKKYLTIISQKKKNYLHALESKALKLYKQDAITKSKEMFIFLLEVDPNNINAKKYITIINQEKEMINYVQEAKRKLKLKKYKDAKIYINRALNISSEYTKAKELLLEINKIAREEIPLHISRGKKLYKEKRFKQALKEFQKVLEFQPDNNTSVILVQKINNRLKTIDALTH